jgi:dienelactone hydrolase
MNRKILWTITCLLLASCTAASLPAQEPPTITLPQPTGQLGVGTAVWHWPDPDRLDELSPAPDDVREIMAQVWYPADTVAAAPTGVYSPLDNDIDHVTGWSQPGVPFTSQIRKAPLIAICPGTRISRSLYTSVAEDLASHGYVVLVPDFPYVGFVAYPDGREISNAFPVPPILQTGPYSAIDQFLETPGALAAGDLRLALDNLEKITDNDPARRLTGKIDWHSLGLFGHSLGSKACGAVAGEGNRFDAVASMEGAFPIAVRERGVKAPVLLMFGVGLPQRIRDTIRQVIPNRRDDIYDLTIPNFLHNNVNELAIIYPTLFPSIMDPYLGLAQTREVLRTFFDEHIKETGPGTLSLPSRIPGATIQFYPGPGHH